MYTNGSITHITETGLRKKHFDAYIEENSSASSNKVGENNKVALFASIPVKQKEDFNPGDFIVIGKINDEIKNGTEEEISKTLREFKSKYRLYIIRSAVPCFAGRPKMWHYELECD